MNIKPTKTSISKSTSPAFHQQLTHQPTLDIQYRWSGVLQLIIQKLRTNIFKNQLGIGIHGGWKVVELDPYGGFEWQNALGFFFGWFDEGVIVWKLFFLLAFFGFAIVIGFFLFFCSNDNGNWAGCGWCRAWCLTTYLCLPYPPRRGLLSPAPTVAGAPHDTIIVIKLDAYQERFGNDTSSKSVGDIHLVEFDRPNTPKLTHSCTQLLCRMYY